MKIVFRTGTMSFLVVLFFACKQAPEVDGKLIGFSNEKLLEIDSIYTNPIEVFEINYLSDSLDIGGFIVKPQWQQKTLPVIIYCRGGNRDFSAIKPRTIDYFKYLASQGYVIAASQYRGNSYSKGVDEFGGEDINDILNLIEILKRNKFVDIKRIGVLGYSRGGMMALKLSRLTDDIQANVVVGPITDLFVSSKERPNLYNGVYLKLIGDTISSRDQYEDRSPTFWASKINEPTLVIHGALDDKVNVNQSKVFMDSLNSYYSGNELVIIEDGSHYLDFYRDKRDSLILKWFDYNL